MPAQEADVGFEVLANRQVRKAEAISVGAVAHTREIAVIFPVQAFGLSLGVVRVDVQVLVERECVTTRLKKYRYQNHFY